MKCLLLALCLAPTLAYAGNAGPCTPSEIQASKMYWNNDGSPKYRAIGAAPKKCNVGKPRFDYPCPKEGSSAAIQFFQQSGPMIVAAASQSHAVYVEGGRLSVEAPHLKLPPARYLFDDGKGLSRATDLVTLPPTNHTRTYLDAASGLSFSVTPRLNPKTGRISLILAFRGTPELGPEGGWKAWFETNLPQDFGHVDAPLYSQAVIAATETILAMQKTYGFEKYCTVPIIYTGHSLGGGLAIHAALRAIKGNCAIKNDAVVGFNPALSTYGKLMVGDHGRNTLVLAAIFQDDKDFIKDSRPILEAFSGGQLTELLTPFSVDDASDVLRSISRDAQVVLYSGVKPGRSVEVHGGHHSIDRMLATLTDMAELAPDNDRRVSPTPAARLCSWYTPVENDRRR